jgi:hypothetical protein
MVSKRFDELLGVLDRFPQKCLWTRSGSEESRGRAKAQRRGGGKAKSLKSGAGQNLIEAGRSSVPGLIVSVSFAWRRKLYEWSRSFTVDGDCPHPSMIVGFATRSSTGGVNITTQTRGRNHSGQIQRVSYTLTAHDTHVLYWRETGCSTILHLISMSCCPTQGRFLQRLDGL